MTAMAFRRERRRLPFLTATSTINPKTVSATTVATRSSLLSASTTRRSANANALFSIVDDNSIQRARRPCGLAGKDASGAPLGAPGHCWDHTLLVVLMDSGARPDDGSKSGPTRRPASRVDENWL